MLTTEERNRIKSRIAKNRDVADGLASGVDTAGDGAARQYVRLDGEGNATAIFAVLQAYEWPAGTPRYLAYCVLSDIDEGIVPANVWLRIYESDGSPINGVPANQNWLPFAENADGTWSTPQIVNYDSLAKAAPTVQRCAVSYLGSSSEDEVTRQVSIIPPNTSGATVRWEGRNGSGSTARRRRGGR